MKFSGKMEDGTSNKPLNFGSKLLPWQRFALSECTHRAKICALQVVLVFLFELSKLMKDITLSLKLEKSARVVSYLEMDFGPL